MGHEMTILRELDEADLALLADRPVPAPRPMYQKISARHHAAAKLVAMGMSSAMVAAATGYTAASINNLKTSPDFVELVEHYRQDGNAMYDSIHQKLTGLSTMAMDSLEDDLEEGKLGPKLKLEIAQLALDRIGHGPQAKSTNVNVNLDIGARMEAAQARWREMKKIA